MKRIAFVFSALYFVSCQQSSSTAEADKDSALVVTDPAVSAIMGDTVTIGNQLYDITPVTAEEFNQVPEWKPDTSEAVNILRDSARVRRAGDSLIFILDNGQQKVMVNNNNSDSEDYTQYTYEAFLSTLGHWMVFNTGYEWYSYELIDSRNGEMTRTIGRPAISPDQQKFICTNKDLMASFTLNGFQLFAIPAPFEKPVLVQEQQLENWGASVMKWKDAKTLFALQHYLDPQSEEHTRYIRLTPRP